MSKEKREYPMRGVEEQEQSRSGEEDRNEREATIVISWDNNGHFLCEGPNAKVRVSDSGELSTYVAKLLAWRRGEPQNMQYPMTAEKLVVDLLNGGQGASVKIPVALNLDADQHSSEAEWTTEEEVGET